MTGPAASITSADGWLQGNSSDVTATHTYISGLNRNPLMSTEAISDRRMQVSTAREFRDGMRTATS
jgi:hypothetical protein